MSKPADINPPDPEVEYEEDLYLQELHKRLASMKGERKKVEKQASVLENRLKLLKGEEEKTWKRIEVTRTKTQNKMSQLEKMEETIRQKMEHKETREKELQDLKSKNLEFKATITSKIQEQRDLKMKEIIEESKRLKEQRKNNEDLMKYIKLEEQNTNKNKYEFIKAQQLLCEERKRANEIEKKNKLKIELENKLLEEQKLREEAEKIVSKLEEEEVETMKRIKTTTQVHKSSK